MARTIARVSILGVGVGVCSWVIVSSVMNGFNETIRVRHLSAQPHVVIELAKGYDPELSRQEVLEQLKKKKIQVDDVEVINEQDVILRTYEGLFGGGVLKGQASEGFKGFYQRTLEALQAGRSQSLFSTRELEEDTWSLAADEVVIGLDLARTLGIFEGDPILVLPPETLLLPKGEAPPYARVRVKSLLSTHLPDIDGKMIFYNREAKDSPFTSALSRRTSLEIRLKNPYLAEALKKDLQKEGFSISTWQDRNKALFFALRLERWAMGLFLGLSTLITCFSIVAVLLLLIHQKRQEIGILMAMGMSPAKIRRIFAGIGLYLSLLGMGTGISLGVLVSGFMSYYPLEILPDIYYDATIPADIEFMQILFILVFSIAIALFASWFPVALSLKESPSACLRPR